MTEDRIVVVPCYNEAQRLDAQGFRRLAAGARLLFVDDGSTDGTGAVLERLCRELAGSASVLTLPANAGKAEAVRQGLLKAVELGAATAGYLDADLATPPEEMLRILDALASAQAGAALGCRVKLRGARIERKPFRRWLGSTFSIAASAVLGMRFRDTQCGAKAFRCTPQFAAAVAQPFHARWAFDVELLGRLIIAARSERDYDGPQFVEVPLRRWREVPNSKLRTLDIPRLGIELLRIAAELMRLRATTQKRLAAGPAVIRTHEDVA